MQESVEPTAHPRGIALVLGGGGFRGAYQAGFLRGLDQGGVEPALISGTSIGALNAYVASAKGLAEPWALWDSLGQFREVFALRLGAAALRGFLVLVSLASLVVLARANRRRHGGITSAILEKFATGSGAFSDDISGWSRTHATLSILYGGMLFGISIFFVPRPVGIVVGALLAILPLISPYLWRWLESRQAAFLRSSLREKLEELLPSAEQAGIAISVTTAILRKVFDYSDISCMEPTYPLPFHKHWMTVYTMERGWIKGVARPRLLPVYHRVEYNNDLTEIFPYALASMSLPLGILPPTVIDGVQHWDGGVTDNLPILPAILDPNIKIIVAIDLARAGKHWCEQCSELHVRRCARLVYSNDAFQERVKHTVRRIHQRLARSGDASLHQTIRRITPHLDSVLFGTTVKPTILYYRAGLRRNGFSTIYMTKRKIRELREKGMQDGLSCANEIRRLQQSGASSN